MVKGGCVGALVVSGEVDKNLAVVESPALSGVGFSDDSVKASVAALLDGSSLVDVCAVVILSAVVVGVSGVDSSNGLSVCPFNGLEVDSSVVNDLSLVEANTSVTASAKIIFFSAKMANIVDIIHTVNC